MTAAEWINDIGDDPSGAYNQGFNIGYNQAYFLGRLIGTVVGSIVVSVAWGLVLLLT